MTELHLPWKKEKHSDGELFLIYDTTGVYVCRGMKEHQADHILKSVNEPEPTEQPMSVRLQIAAMMAQGTRSNGDLMKRVADEAMSRDIGIADFIATQSFQQADALIAAEGEK